MSRMDKKGQNSGVQNYSFALLKGQAMAARITSPHHRPTHIYADDTFYFVTATNLHHAPRLAPAGHKEYLQEQFLNITSAYGLDLKAWVILNNHYHILFHLGDGEKLSPFIKNLHTNTAIAFNEWDNQPGRQVW